MTLFEVDEAANRIRKEVDEDANIIFGSSVEEDLNGRLRVSVVATGIDAARSQPRSRRRPRWADAWRRRPRPETLTPGSGQPSGAGAARAGDGLPVAGRWPRPGARRAAAPPMVLARPGLASGRRLRPGPLGPVADAVARGRGSSGRQRPGLAAAAARRPSRCGAACGRPAARPPVPGVSNGIRRIFQEMTGGGPDAPQPARRRWQPRLGHAAEQRSGASGRAPAWPSAAPQPGRDRASTSRPSCAGRSTEPTDGCARAAKLRRIFK